MQNEAQTILIDINQVKATTGFRSTTSIYELMKSRGFPKPINIGNRTKRWLANEIQNWINSQIENSRGEA